MILFYPCFAQTFKYDGANRLIQISSNCSGTIYAYDLNGNHTSITQIIIATISNVIDERCGNDGRIAIIPKDSTAKYRYQWSSGQTTANIKNLSYGNYSVIITEPITGFTCNQSFIIKPAFKDSISVIPFNTTCYGGSNGKAKINIVIPNPTGTYVYHWSTNTDTTFNPVDSVTNLRPGSYSVTIRNTATGCIKARAFTIGQPLAFLTGINPTPISCYLANDGTATAVVTDSADQYTFSWKGVFNGTKTSQQITNLAPGRYTVICTQKTTNCVLSDTVSIAPVPKFLSITKTDSKCYKASNGSATALVTNNPSQYQYAWTGPFTGSRSTKQINNLSAGVYRVRVTENFGNHCSEIDSVVITEPQTDNLEDVLITAINCKGQNDGIAEAKVLGSINNYSYQWYYQTENGYISQNSYKVTGLKPGQYTLTITSLDSNACISTKQFSIAESTIIATTSTLYPNPTDGKITVVVCNLQTIAANYILYSSSGQILMQGTATSNNGTLPFNLTSLHPGAYVLSITVSGETLNFKVVKI
ncbi:MAG: C-terminal target protein [Mucilaginibacter sp.]|nr:C-terminal target protein [Mucilaginibacter sp.]